jgi:hypothetical protein
MPELARRERDRISACKKLHGFATAVGHVDLHTGLIAVVPNREDR